MQFTRTRYGMLTVLLTAVALMLAGCGGDDGVDESLHMALQQERDALQEDLDEAQEDLMDAQTDLDAAQHDLMDAQEDLMDTQADLDDAQEDLMDTEADLMDTEADLMDTEADLMDTEADLMDTQEAQAQELMDVKDAAAAAEEAAEMAADAAARDATAAANATEHIATLQTVEMKTTDTYTTNRAMKMADNAEKAAAAAMMAYKAAEAAAIAADEAETIEAATEAKVMAEAEQAKAEMYAMTASEQSMGAVEYAMKELMIDGAMKSVGDSSINANMGQLREGTVGDDRRVTGFIADVSRETRAVEGQHFIQNTGPADEVKYKQAVAAGSVNIGKTLDTTDDMARLRLITSYQGSKPVRVFVDGNGEATDATLGGLLSNVAVTGLLGFPLDDDVDDVATGNQQATVKAIGTYYMATDRTTPPAATDVEGDPAADTGANVAGALGAYDMVNLTDGGQPHEIYELSYGTIKHHARVVETITNAAGETTKHYQPVDIMANASMTDGGDSDALADNIHPVTVRIPVAKDYAHLHFGVWASLGDADVDKDLATQMLTNLGMGFLQNISDSGITEKQGIGTATFRGDWVAAVQRAHGEGEGSIQLGTNKATLTANFGTDKFTGVLAGLATLEGDLMGNGFEGMKATADRLNIYGLTVDASFTGMFEGGIYGPDGAEAGGVFDFSSESDGAFRGAFGAHRDGSP